MTGTCPTCSSLVLQLPTLLGRVNLNATPGEGRWSLKGDTARFTGKGLYTNHATTCQRTRKAQTRKWKNR